MTLWTAYFLGVGTTFAVLAAGWIVLRIAGPWAMAHAAAVPVGFLHIVGMRIRRTNPDVVVSTLVVLAKSGQPISPFKLEAIYMTLPENARTTDDLLHAARQHATAAVDA